MAKKPTDRNGNELTGADLLSPNAGNSASVDANGLIYVSTPAVVVDDQVLSGATNTNVAVTLTPTVVTPPEGGTQTNYQIAASLKLGSTLTEDPVTKVVNAANPYVDPIYSADISTVTVSGSDGQFLYITNTGDEFGVIDEVYTWIGGMWSPYPIQPTAVWTSATSNPTATGNTGTLPRFVENTTTGSLWYIDSTGVAKQIEKPAVLTPQVVFVNSTSPSTATIFDTANPPVTNNAALQNLDAAIYVGSDGSLWTSNGTVYTAGSVAGTPFYLVGGTTDAGSNKTAGIYRTGLVRSSDSTAGTGNSLTLDGANALGPRLQAGTNTTPSQYFEFGAYSNQNNFDTKNRNFQMFSSTNANAYSMNAATGWQGINLTPGNILSVFDVNGSFGANLVKSSAASYTQTSTDFTVVMQTSGAIFALASSVNRRIINVKNGSTGSITAAGHIDNVANTTITIPAGQSRMMHGDGTTWWII